MMVTKFIMMDAFYLNFNIRFLVSMEYKDNVKSVYLDLFWLIIFAKKTI